MYPSMWGGGAGHPVTLNCQPGERGYMMAPALGTLENFANPSGALKTLTTPFGFLDFRIRSETGPNSVHRIRYRIRSRFGPNSVFGAGNQIRWTEVDLPTEFGTEFGTESKNIGPNPVTESKNPVGIRYRTQIR